MIPTSIQQAYQSQSVPADLLLAEIKELFGNKDPKWFFSARKKTPESFYQKIEAGATRNPFALEDFVGAMLVVPMLSDLSSAITFVDRFFVTETRRPSASSSTQKKSSDFAFDDLRLYGHLLPSEDLPPRPIDAIVFEIQIKTFLQHAWSIATHDLVYKFDRVSWARSRVAYQLKALLEHADISVSSIADLEASEHLPGVGQPESHLQGLIDLISDQWSEDILPIDRRRQAMNLDSLAQALDLTHTSDLETLLQQGKTHYRNIHPEGLTPYQCVVDYASHFLVDPLRSALIANDPSSILIFVTPDVLTRLGLSIGEARNSFV